MSLLYIDTLVPEDSEEIQEFLEEIESFFNGLSDVGGGFKLTIQEEETPDGRWQWQIIPSGAISDGQDNDGRELWKSPDLSSCYAGNTIQEAAGQLFDEVKINYGDRLPS